MDGRRHSAKYSVVTGTGKLIALNQGDGPSSHREGKGNGGMDPSDLYACFSWKVEHPSQFYVHEVNSPIFNVCGTQWVISTCQDPDIQNCVSLFFCVANRDMLLPGWSQYAQFTVSAINENPKKSIHCDGFHRFSKSELDWGWKDFMTLAEMVDGFITDNSIELKIQVQLIREKPHPFFSCINRKYRRELFREMGFEIEETCFEFFKEQKTRITSLASNTTEITSFGTFYKSLEEGARRKLSQERTHSICTALVEKFMKGEDTNTAVLIEMLHLGMEALVNVGDRNRQSIVSISDDTSMSLVSVKNGMFSLADDISKVINSFLREDRPWNYEPILLLKDRTSVEDLREEYPYEEEEIFAEIGRKTLVIYATVHIFCDKMYPEYIFHMSLKKQDELLQELDTEREKRINKHQKSKKAKRKSKKQKDRVMDGQLKVHCQQNITETDQGCSDPTDVSVADNGSATREGKLLTHLLEEPLTSSSTTEDAERQLGLDMDNLLIDQSVMPWTRKESKKSRAARTRIKKSGDSFRTRDISLKERQKRQNDHSLKNEHSENPGNHRGIFRQSLSTNDPEVETIKKIEASKAPLTSSQPSRVVDLSEKSWADFHLGLAFGSSSLNVSYSQHSEDFPFMNMINYIWEDEFL